MAHNIKLTLTFSHYFHSLYFNHFGTYSPVFKRMCLEIYAKYGNPQKPKKQLISKHNMDNIIYIQIYNKLYIKYTWSQHRNKQFLIQIYQIFGDENPAIFHILCKKSSLLDQIRFAYQRKDSDKHLVCFAHTSKHENQLDFQPKIFKLSGALYITFHM